jgi:uncharacterized protein (DUF2235 family)
MAKNIVICCDGTGNEIRTNLSNVLKLYRCVDKSMGQTVFYDPGIGTIGMDSEWQGGKQLKEVFSQATGAGLYKNILDAYKFLIDTYEPGDNIYMFGFSRGAYTVRALGGFINLIGLLKPEQTNLADYALKAYKDSSSKQDLSIGWRFGHVMDTRHVPIKFMGVWDTVNSVIVPRRDHHLFKLEFERLPYSMQNPDVEVFRQALAIDEKRRMFRPKEWREPGIYQPDPWKDETSKSQDIKQVWFAGDHSDIGGGYPEAESGLAKLPLKWMIDEAEKAGLRFDHKMVSHIVGGESEPGAHNYCSEDPLAPLHNSLHGAWNLLEWVPKSVKEREWPERKSFMGWYLPGGEPRYIPDDAIVDRSVFERMQKDPSYRPPNLPAHYRVEEHSQAESKEIQGRSDAAAGQTGGTRSLQIRASLRRNLS